MVTDEEYDAALALEIWCQEKIEEGAYSIDTLPASEQIEYYNLVMDWERHSLSSIQFSYTDDSYELILLRRTATLIKLMARNIIDKYCS